MSTITLRTIARTNSTAMRQVVLDGAPQHTYVFIDLTGTKDHTIVTAHPTDLLGDARVQRFDSLADLATALRDRFELAF